MASLNKITLIGNLGADPETRYTQGGDAVTNIRLATTDTWKDKTTGESRDNTEWHRVVFYRRLAEIAGQYLKKGAQVYLEGRIRTRKWQDKDGQERYTTEIEATELKMLGGRREDDGEPRRDTGQEHHQQPRRESPAQKQAPSFADMEDDIPF